jgi:hypothetical protein
MRVLRWLSPVAVGLLCVTHPVQAQERLAWRPGFVIPIGIGAHGGIGTWGSRIALIVGEVTTPERGDSRARGIVLLGEAATDRFRAVGVGVGFSAGVPLGPVHIMPGVAGRITINAAAWNPDLTPYRRKAVGVSASLTVPILSYSLALYRELEDDQREGGWQWRLGLGLGF